MGYAARHIARGLKNEGVRAGRGCFQQAILTIVDTRHLAKLREVSTQQGEMMPLVEPAQTTQLGRGCAIVEVCEKCVTRVGGNRADLALSQKLDSLANQPDLWILGMQHEILCHVRDYGGFLGGGMNKQAKIAVGVVVVLVLLALLWWWMSGSQQPAPTAPATPTLAQPAAPSTSAPPPSALPNPSATDSTPAPDLAAAGAPSASGALGAGITQAEASAPPPPAVAAAPVAPTASGTIAQPTPPAAPNSANEQRFPPQNIRLADGTPAMPPEVQEQLNRIEAARVPQGSLAGAVPGDGTGPSLGAEGSSAAGGDVAIASLPSAEELAAASAARSNTLRQIAEASQPSLRDSLLSLVGRDAFIRFIVPDNFALRVVATVDSLPRRHAAPRLWPVHVTPGRFTVEETDNGLVVSANNAQRYDGIVSLAQRIETDWVVRIYARFYPAFQAAYEELGYSGRSFNDRAVEVLDHLLTTPPAPEPSAARIELTEVRGPLESVSPWLRYEFADPALRDLSSGQRMLLRVGPENQAVLMGKLRELRGALAGGQ